jgi:hypothetical protein
VHRPGLYRWMVLTALLAGLFQAGQVQVRPGAPTDVPPDETEPAKLCLGDLVSSFSLSPGTLNIGEGVTLSWNVIVGGSCQGMTWTIEGPGMFHPAVGRSGPRVVYPDGSGSYVLRAHMSALRRELGTASVVVLEPPLPVVDGRPNIAITSNDESARFVQAIGTKNAIVRIANDVQLDLSGRENVPIAGGVQIIGGRSSTEPGPKLYTRTFPRQLFQIGLYEAANNVRVTGVRLEGAEMGIAPDSAPSSNGITVYSSVNVEIDHNEISGWRGSAVDVRDPRDRLHLSNYNAVRVHDNFIHHNQHYRREGYGVSVHESGYTLIERNVFDYNRHAIASGGTPGIGYYAQSNLVLEHGGLNSGTLNLHTHQFDVHGTESCCLAELYCGKAGERFEFRYNTIMYDHGTAIKVRGRPSMGALAEFNVFKHPDEWGGCVDDSALVQNGPDDAPATTKLVSRNNSFGAQWHQMSAPSQCDFNADGTNDSFIATGATWWYASSKVGGLVYLRDSLKRMANLTVGHFNRDRYCDVKDDTGVVYLTPPGPELHGRRLQATDSPWIYLILDGKRYGIPDDAIYSNVFRNREGIETVDVSAIANGGTLSTYAKLARSADEPAVYLITNDRKHWITSPQAMDTYNFDWNKIVALPRTVIDSLARGGDLNAGPIGVTRSVVPNVVGQKLAAASAAITAAGFVRGTVRHTPDPTCNNIGDVIRQTPAAGTVVAPGTSVNLTVGGMPPTPCL